MIRVVRIRWYKEIFQADQKGRGKYRWLDHKILSGHLAAEKVKSSYVAFFIPMLL